MWFIMENHVALVVSHYDAIEDFLYQQGQTWNFFVGQCWTKQKLTSNDATLNLAK